jgi:alanine-synthesizing transaminase
MNSVLRKQENLFANRTNWNLAPNRLGIALAERRAAGKPVLDLTASNPTECGFTYDNEAILAALSNPLSLTFDPEPRGLRKAREAVCAYYADRGDQVSPENILLTTSTSEAYSFVFRLLCNPGDEVLVPQPSYPLFDFLADLQDVRLVRYPLLYDHGWQIDFHSLEQALTARTRAIIVVNPNNPTGNFCKPHEMAQLNEICAARGIAVIADEVFLDYSVALSASQSVAAPLPRSLPQPSPSLSPRSFATNSGAVTFTMSGLSKIAGLPQMKAAWLVTSGPAAQTAQALARLEVIADTYLSMNAPVQHALPTLLQRRHALQKQLQARVAGNQAELDRQLDATFVQRERTSHERTSSEQGTLSRLHLEGGWYALLELPANRSSDDLAMQLLTTRGLYVHPAHFYDFPTDRFLIVSLITPLADFSAGIRSLIEFATGGLSS